MLFDFNEEQEKEIVELMKEGAIFIYPADTVYGIGCNAEKEESVKRIKEIKGRDASKPMSIIAPSKQWIKENLEIMQEQEELIGKYLPGAYTLILRKKNKDFLNNVSPTETLGIRIPNCDFTRLVEKAEVPFITTSVNLSGEPPAKQIEEVKPEILEQADVIINTGVLPGTSSTIIKEDGSELKR